MLPDAPLYPSQDGPGAGAVVEVVVRVMVGPDRSTVVVRRGREPVLLNEVRPHGAEADGLGAAVEPPSAKESVPSKVNDGPRMGSPKRLI
jgi:hypothetical protein